MIMLCVKTVKATPSVVILWKHNKCVITLADTRQAVQTAVELQSSAWRLESCDERVESSHSNSQVPPA